MEVEAAPRCRRLHQAGLPQQHREEPRCHHRGAADADRQARGARSVQRGETVRTNPAILGTFSIIDKGVTDKENAEQLAKVRETLERLDWRAGRPT